MRSSGCGSITSSVWCAALAGAEIIRKKAELGHGNGFEEWKESLPFSRVTAAHYMKLAERMHDELAKLPRAEMEALAGSLQEASTRAEKALALLQLPSPMDAFNPVHEKISKIVQKITGGATMRQLMFDWGIVAQPKPINPALLDAPPLAPGDTAEHRAAVDVLDAALKELWKLVRDMKTHLLLHLPELKHVSVELMDLRRIIDEQIKRG
jgi:hypothetical protein